TSPAPISEGPTVTARVTERARRMVRPASQAWKRSRRRAAGVRAERPRGAATSSDGSACSLRDATGAAHRLDGLQRHLDPGFCQRSGGHILWIRGRVAGPRVELEDDGGERMERNNMVTRTGDRPVATPPRHCRAWPENPQHYRHH